MGVGCWWLPSKTLFSEEVFQPVHVECECKAKRLVERVALGSGNHVARIEREDVHFEACTHGEILSVTLVLTLVVVSCTKSELVVVNVLGTHAPLNLLHLLLEAVRCVVEALEHTADTRHVVVLLLLAHGIFLRTLTLVLLRIGGNEQFVGVGCDGETVVLVDRHHQRTTQTQVRRDELGNIDATVCAEHPKLNPHIPAMKEVMAEVMGISPDDISIKATTTERLGFTGREEGMSAYAVALITKD